MIFPFCEEEVRDFFVYPHRGEEASSPCRGMARENGHVEVGNGGVASVEWGKQHDAKLENWIDEGVWEVATGLVW